MNIAVFVSGRGSNLQAIINSKDLEGLAAVAVVCSDKIDCPAFKIASEKEIPYFSVSEKKREGFYNFSKLKALFAELHIELIVLAGYLKLMPTEFVKAFPNKIINIHPALLPSFGGKGMYGHHVHEAVFQSSAKVSGATIHFVNEHYDEGMIIDQAVVSIADVKSPDEIAARVLAVEHKLLPSVIAKIAAKKIEIKDNRVFLI